MKNSIRREANEKLAKIFGTSIIIAAVLIPIFIIAIFSIIFSNNSSNKTSIGEPKTLESEFTVIKDDNSQKTSNSKEISSKEPTYEISSEIRSHFLAISELDQEGIFSTINTDASYNDGDYEIIDSAKMYGGNIVTNSNVDSGDNFIVFSVDKTYEDLMDQEKLDKSKDSINTDSTDTNSSCLISGESLSWYHYCVNGSLEMADDRVYVKKNANYVNSISTKNISNGKLYCHLKKQIGNDLHRTLGTYGVDYCVYDKDGIDKDDFLRTINANNSSELMTRIVNYFALTPRI